MGNTCPLIDVANLSTLTLDDIAHFLEEQQISSDGRALLKCFDIQKLESKSVVGLINLGFTQTDSNKLIRLFEQRKEFMQKNLEAWTYEKLSKWVMENCTPLTLKIVKEERYTPILLGEFAEVQDMITVLDFPAGDAMKLFDLVVKIRRGDFLQKNVGGTFLTINTSPEWLQETPRNSGASSFLECPFSPQSFCTSLTPSTSPMPESPTFSCPLSPPPVKAIRTSESMYLHNAGGSLIPDLFSPRQFKRMPKSNLGFASIFSSNPNLFNKISQVEQTMRRPHNVERYFVDMRAMLITSFDKFHLQLSGVTAHIICIYAISSNHIMFHFQQIQTNVFQNAIKDVNGKNISKIEARNTLNQADWNFEKAFKIFYKRYPKFSKS